MPNVIFGILGSQLDRGQSSDRWHSWRPNVAICQHEDFVVDQFELVFDAKEEKLANIVAKDIASVSPETTVHLRRVELTDPWDFEEVYTTLHSLLREFHFNSDRDKYFAHITTGTHVEQICWFLLTETRHLPSTGVATNRDTHAGLRRFLSDNRLGSIEVRPAGFPLRPRAQG